MHSNGQQGDRGRGGLGNARGHREGDDVARSSLAWEGETSSLCYNDPDVFVKMC